FVRAPGEGRGRHGTKGQIHIMPVDGGEARCVTDLPFGATDPRWLPDGRRLLAIAEFDLDAPTPEGTAARIDETKDDPSAFVTEDVWFRHWDTWLPARRRHHVVLVDVESEAVTNLTPRLTGRLDPMDASGQYDIAPDGREIALTVFETNRQRVVRSRVLTMSIPAAGAKSQRAGAPKDRTPRGVASCDDAVYDPSGRWLVMGVRDDARRWSTPTDVVAVDRRTGRAHPLTERWDRSASSWRISEDGRHVLILALTEGRTGLFRVPLPKRGTSAGRPRVTEVARGGAFSGLRASGRRCFVTESTLQRPAEVVAIEGRERRAVTAFTAPWRRELAMGRVEDVSFPGTNDVPVQMYLVHPPAGAPRRTKRGKVPLVHLIHGGPHGVFGDEWHHRWNAQAIAAQGYLVALVNFHGSVGWGRAFADSIVGRWGDQPFEDIMRATDWLIGRRHVDAGRMAATGGSYGGYMASWIAARTDRFACIINHAGVCDLQTQFGSDLVQGWPESSGGTVWDDRDGLDRWSPLRHAAGFRSPMLIIHGERDYRVPYIEALQIYNIYKLRNLPARLVHYPDENHWILKPRNSVHWYGEFTGWLERWMG
ncbi:MAG: S9 family peptidase, partial [Phycisphaerales bacterium]|nr:S9 family peptidase [Phycisphaerales bacterium]